MHEHSTFDLRDLLPVHRIEGRPKSYLSYTQILRDLEYAAFHAIATQAQSLAVGCKISQRHVHVRMLSIAMGHSHPFQGTAKILGQTDLGQPGYTDTLGWIYFRKHLNDSAIQVFRILTQEYPDDATFHYHLGLALRYSKATRGVLLRS